ncbi:SpoIIE family protein phosphatase [Nonomuraea phyllanthi]|uniref:PP2C family protein-serine/threonine phosphatase n=1 Tax=Nonomuraea phyllanthi TaxID=2219224 RepID=UPI00129353CB|nr:GAF domain-containing SpoIIE family protein phosphatase [Nonomuraea phyllanthi]QFY13437.1 SpoIIE family protein phosphatase [Nonomuraea phyllanthi]
MTRPASSAPDPGEAIESSRLDDLLIEAVFSAGAHFGIVYVLDADARVLRMETAIGLPADVAQTWARIRTNDRVPVAVSVRERRLIWAGDRVALARGFPTAALALPYHFSVAASPVCSGGDVWGGFVLGWPAGGETVLDRRRLDVIEDACARMGPLLRRASEHGRAVEPHALPRILDPVRAHRADPYTALRAMACLNCLPEGYCHLDGHGLVTLVTPPAAGLLAAKPSEMVGQRMCEALPWLDEPVYEDRFQAAIADRQATQFTARHPDGRQLSFQCYPSLPGITIRIMPATTSQTGTLDAGPGVIGQHDLLHLAISLARAMTAQDVVDLVADDVMPVCDAQAMAILTWDSGRMRVVASRGYSRRGIEKFDGRPVVRAVRWARGYDEGRAAFYSDWDEFHQTYPGAVRVDDMGAWALLPLVAQGRSIGTCVLAYDRPHRFGDSERAMLTALGGLVTQAFERAWLYDNKHQLAQSMQTNLLPKDLPEFPGLEVAARYVPATPGMDLGGDFYDLIRLSDTEAAAVIGDVQGHDMTAVALMGQVRTAIHTHASAGATCGEVLAHTNQLMTELAPDRFTSCLYLTLDLEDHTACLASAGHLPPLLSRPGVPTQVLDTTPGPLLGIDPDAEYATTDLHLPPGSVLTLYTDGLIEEPGCDLGEAIAALAARFAPAPGQPLRGLAESLLGPASTRQRADDTALLLLRNTPRPP